MDVQVGLLASRKPLVGKKALANQMLAGVQKSIGIKVLKGGAFYQTKRYRTEPYRCTFRFQQHAVASICTCVKVRWLQVVSTAGQSLLPLTRGNRERLQ